MYVYGPVTHGIFDLIPIWKRLLLLYLMADDCIKANVLHCNVTISYIDIALISLLLAELVYH